MLSARVAFRMVKKSPERDRRRNRICRNSLWSYDLMDGKFTVVVLFTRMPPCGMPAV